VFFFSSRRRHTRFSRDWSSDVCSSDLSVSLRSAMPEMPSAGSCRDERVEPLQRAVFLEQPAVDRFALEFPVGLDGVALYDQRPRALLAPVLVLGIDRLHVAYDRRPAAAPVALPPVCTHRSAPAVAAGRAHVGDATVVPEDLGDVRGTAGRAAEAGGGTSGHRRSEEVVDLLEDARRHRNSLPSGRAPFRPFDSATTGPIRSATPGYRSGHGSAPRRGIRL